jgi:GT2 family glycosyltransferase
MKVTIVVPYNTQVKMTVDFLDNMMAMGPYPFDVHCILVNGGCETDIDHPFVNELVKLKTNEGTVKVYNAGLREVPDDTDYVFFVGNDSFPVERSWLVDLVLLQQSTRAWIVCPANDRPGMNAYQSLYTKDCGEYWEADFFPSIAWLIPYCRLQQIGLLDERYIRTGMYADNDYCRRVRNAGGTIVVSKNIMLRHLLSQESGVTGTINEDMNVNGKAYNDKWSGGV